MNTPKGTIVFTTVGRPYYGFDVFSVDLSSTTCSTPLTETQLTDGLSINFNAQFVHDQEQHHGLVFISERSGSPQVYLKRLASSSSDRPEHLATIPNSLFHDRPAIKNQKLYFISAHVQPDQPFRSWSALYSVPLVSADLTKGSIQPQRLSPSGTVDYSPAVSPSGKLIAVASYGSRQWDGEFHELQTEIVVFKDSDPPGSSRTLVCEHGGWPTWSTDSIIYFHRRADDGWWSIYKTNLTVNNYDTIIAAEFPTRVTPPGVHAFTPAAFQNNNSQIAVATRRKTSKFRHIEIYDLQTQTFIPVTENLNPGFHHYNPFVSPDSSSLGYHRFRGESRSTIPHLEPVTSSIEDVQMLRLNGSFPSFSPDGEMIALNHDFGPKSGLKIIKSDGSKRWTLLKDRVMFYNSWSPTEHNVIYCSIGPIFQSAMSTVQVARIEFDSSQLDDREEIDARVTILTKEDSGNNAFPACSADGKSIVFRSGRSGHKNLYVMDAVNGEMNGRGIRRLTEGPWIDTMPAWSPDGEMIAFSSNRQNPNNAERFSIYIVRPDGSDLRRVHVAGSEERINHVCFSADNAWLLFTCNLGGVTAEPVSLPNQFQPYGDLYVARLDGTGLRRMTWNGYENGTPTWSPGAGRLSATEVGVGDELRNGEFDDPLWITCDL